MADTGNSATGSRAATAEELVEAIRRIYTTQVYEGGDMHKGISVEMVAAMHDAAVLAGVCGPHNPWYGLGMLEEPDPEDVRAWRDWQEKHPDG